MKINIVYKSEVTMDNLCFICAVQRAMHSDAKESNIYLEEYAHYDGSAKCADCGKYLDDSITI